MSNFWNWNISQNPNFIFLKKANMELGSWLYLGVELESEIETFQKLKKKGD
jgi:hypothetical protein